MTLTPRLPRFLPVVILGAGLLSSVPAADPDGTRRVQFLEGVKTEYLLAPSPRESAAWTGAVRASAPESTVELGSRVVLRLDPALALETLLRGRELTLARTVAPGLHILQALDSSVAIREAEELSSVPGVTWCRPVLRRPWEAQGGYAPAPDDPYFPVQWNLDNRSTDRNRAGPDLNIRAAWEITRGEGITVAIGDDGVQSAHPDLADRRRGDLDFNFYRGLPGGDPASAAANHGTEVAGLLCATEDNREGIAGVAPDSRFTSWVLFGTSAFGFDNIASDEAMMDMFQYASNQVAVQNHSWQIPSLAQVPLEPLADLGISNAVTFGRDGLGVVIVRAAGNYRGDLANANDDGFAADPRVIAVAAIRRDGRVASYSDPGANILLGAPSGDPTPPEGEGPATADLRTSDRTGPDGTEDGSTGDPDYTGLSGTSASSPQIAGVAALILSANPALGFRDVQHILIQSARPTDLADPAAKTNGAGFVVSDNVGFGMPDAGVAVDLAKRWTPRDPPVRVEWISNSAKDIPDNALRTGVANATAPAFLRSIACLPSLGVHPDEPTGNLPLEYVDQATAPITRNLSGKGALIRRGGSLFGEKIERAAAAGAAFAIVFNNTGTTELETMWGTKFSRIPAVFIGRTDGEALQRYLTVNPAAVGRIRLTPATYSLNVTNTLICTHVGVRLQTTHPRRSDVRVTLVSPMGTRSVLQSINMHAAPGPVDWTYWSTQHFYESSAGTWQLEVSDERSTTLEDPSGVIRPATGSVTQVRLIIEGIPIKDFDRDGLDDDWERASFGRLSQDPLGDPDEDGYSNAREQILRTIPTVSNAAFRLERSDLEPGYWRFTWPSREGIPYRFRSGPGLSTPLSQRTTRRGTFPYSEYVVPSSSDSAAFFRVEFD
ncbi:MAG: S8 family serine peptidase [Verrucomicrobiales bacterium]|nr:S8 family serine peptidase [Verrucomicrobiales bacterium]